ncbi:MAG: alpha-2-macroglobulin, partial [Verrucomicrobiales bacterium]
PRGRTILDRDVTFGSSGALDQEIDLPGENPGDYRLKLDFADSSEGNSSYWNRNVYHHFRVDDYALNTFEVDLETKEFDPFGGEIPISLSARYLMGKPLSSAKYSWSATVMPREFSAPGFGSFHFGRRSEREHHSYHGRGELSGEGKAEITLLTPSGEGGPGPRSVYFNTEVTDINQQTISRSTSVKIDGSDYYLGVRRPGSARVDGDPIRIEAVAVTAAGGRYRGETPVRCLIERKEFNAVRMKTASGEMVTRSEALWVPVKEVQSVLTAGHDDTGTLLALLEPDSAGWYAVTLHSTDGGGRPVETRMEFHVGGAGERSFARREGVRIDLQPDKEAYAPGETAMVSIESPIAGTALITVERSRVSRSYLREVGRNGTIVEIPIEKGDGPNVFISALVVRGAVDSPRKFREPEFKLGYCELRVEDQTNVLDVELAPSQPSYQPGEKVAIEGRVRDRAGSPVTGAEVTLFAVDEGVLSLMGFEVPDPFRTFHAPFALAVRSAITLTGMMSENPDEQTFENKGRLIGGGGEEALWQGNQRDDFRACAYWGASERTDGEGRIRVEFEAPDSLTRYRIVAVVSAGAERFGRAESAFEINQPLMIEPALARFGNAGDRVQAKGIVFNTSDYSGEFRVTLSLDPTSRFDGDAELEGDAAGAASMKRSRLITLAAGETGAVVFPVRFVEPGSAQWTWEVQPAPAGGSDPLAANLSDRRLSKLEIGHPMPLLKESYFTRLQPGESWDDVLARVDTELRRGKGVVTVSISRSRMLEAADALEYILRYPYGCVEQTTSSLLPWVRLRGLRRELPGLKKTDEEILAAIQGGADRLLGMQTGSGGLGYWPGSSHPMLWGSAYGGLGLTLAKESGAEVPEASLSSLYDYLADALRNVSQEKEHERMIELCLGAYTLAVAGRAEHAYHELLFNQRSRLSSEARYLVAMAILESGGDRAMARTLLTDAGAGLGGWGYWHGPSHRRSLELIAWS